LFILFSRLGFIVRIWPWLPLFSLPLFETGFFVRRRPLQITLRTISGGPDLELLFELLWRSPLGSNIVFIRFLLPVAASADRGGEYITPYSYTAYRGCGRWEL
jgi:hypothetical protein